MLRILYDDFDQKVKNIHDEMDLHHSYRKKACNIARLYSSSNVLTTNSAKQILYRLTTSSLSEGIFVGFCAFSCLTPQNLNDMRLLLARIYFSMSR